MFGQIMTVVGNAVKRTVTSAREMFAGGPVLDADNGQVLQPVSARPSIGSRALLGLCLFALVLGLSFHGYCGDSDLTSLVTDAGTLWTSVKTFILGVVTFVLLLAVVKLIRKK